MIAQFSTETVFFASLESIRHSFRKRSFTDSDKNSVPLRVPYMQLTVLFLSKNISITALVNQEASRLLLGRSDFSYSDVFI